MRKKLVLFFCFFLLFYGCRNSSNQETATVDDISLERLVVENTSLLGKMDKSLSCNYPEEVEKYTVSLEIRAKDVTKVNLKVITNGEETLGAYPYYNCSLIDGNNEIKVISTSKKDASNEKTYTIKITKKTSTAPNESSSRLKELKVDGNSILSLLNDKNMVTLSDVDGTKDKVTLYVLPHNSEASIDVSNASERVDNVSDNTYDVNLAFGQNDINVTITSANEGAKRHVIKIYRKEDLSLKSFNVDGTEYCENGSIKESIIRFPKEKTECTVNVEPNAGYATITLKCNGHAITPTGISYKVSLNDRKNEIEVIVKGNGGIKTRSYEVTFMKIISSPNVGKLLVLKADDKDVLHSLSKDNVVTLASCNNEKTTLKVEAKATSGISIKVFNETEISGNGVYDVPLKVGENKIDVKLYSASDLVNTYSIFVVRYPAQDVPNAPTGEEVQVSIVLSDGVNGSSVDGSYVNIFKTKTTVLLKRVLVRDGKVKVNLPKNNFYDFKVEGRNTDYSFPRYAASDVISYYVDEKTKTIPIIQFPLKRITRPAVAPSIKEFKFDRKVLDMGEVHSTDRMKNVEIKVLTSSSIEELDWGTPSPMLSIGFVPTNNEKKDEDVFYATQTDHTSKNTEGKYQSTWSWNTYGKSLLKGDIFDVVLVVYDLANNRCEYHVRFNTSGTTTEDTTITFTDIKMEFQSFPTPSYTFSVGKDDFTHSSSHYSNRLFFKVKRGTNHVPCKGFDLYRKCIEDGEDFRLVKHFIYDYPIASSDGGTNGYHTLKDNDGVLEEGKTYQYKMIAYTNDDKKSKLEGAEKIEIKVPKSTSLLLHYPVNQAITKDEAKNLGYVFKLSNPKILETAKEIHLGFLISDKAGEVPYCSKFKYVFEDIYSSGKDEIYFATLQDAKVYQGRYYLGTGYSKKRNTLTHKEVKDLIKIDKDTGSITLTKDFMALSTVNLAKNYGNISYEEGYAYYWDVLDWGINEYSDRDDLPCKIVSKEMNGVTIISTTNDERNGNNAINGRAEFTVRFD